MYSLLLQNAKCFHPEFDTEEGGEGGMYLTDFFSDGLKI